MAEVKVFELGNFGRSNATREKGRAVFSQLQNEWERQPAARPELIVDWSGVNVASPGFIDEFIGLLCPEGGSRSRGEGIIFAGSNDYITQQIHAILLRRGCALKYAPDVAAAQAGQGSMLGAGAAESLNPAPVPP